jgi:hypothetical protein
MARLAADSPLRKIRGHVGQFVFKQYGDDIIVTKYPDMDGIKPSRLQQLNRSLFKEAVAYARRINRNPALKAEYLQKVSPGKSVYHYAIKEYLKMHRCK